MGTKIVIMAAVLIAATAVIGINSIPTVKAATAQNPFGAAVQSQAVQSQGIFGEHQSTIAEASGGLGSFNCATCTPLHQK